jgi:hypothetical protein
MINLLETTAAQVSWQVTSLLQYCDLEASLLDAILSLYCVQWTESANETEKKSCFAAYLSSFPETWTHDTMIVVQQSVANIVGENTRLFMQNIKARDEYSFKIKLYYITCDKLTIGLWQFAPQR